jgi:hypothetical protein
MSRGVRCDRPGRGRHTLNRNRDLNLRVHRPRAWWMAWAMARSGTGGCRGGCRLSLGVDVAQAGWLLTPLEVRESATRRRLRPEQWPGAPGRSSKSE